MPKTIAGRSILVRMIGVGVVVAALMAASAGHAQFETTDPDTVCQQKLIN
jgi:hypothetical protein